MREKAKKIVARRASKTVHSAGMKSKLSDGQINLLKSHGYQGLTEQRLAAMKRAHARYLAGAKFRPNSASGPEAISLEEAERRVEKYLESMAP